MTINAHQQGHGSVRSQLRLCTLIICAIPTRNALIATKQIKEDSKILQNASSASHLSHLFFILFCYYCF